MTGPAPEVQTEEKPAAPSEQTDLLLHPDDAELAELERLAAEEEASLKTEDVPEPEEAPAPPQPQPMIPKARLDEVLRQGGELQSKLEELSRHNAYLAGQLQVLGKPTAEQPQVPVNPVLEVKQRLFALGDRYDAGEMTMREFLEQRDALDQEMAQAVTEAARPTPEQLNGDPIVATATARMEAENPWFSQIPQFVIDRMLVGTARDMLEERGIPVTQDARGTLVLRQAVIDVAKMVGFDKQYGGAQQAPAAPQGVTAAERQAKIDLSQRLPPNPARVGSSQQIDPMDPATLAEMSDSDLAALPASVLDRLTR
jgi:hypothetical protein